MVAEVVPEKRRVEAGALLYTSAPVGLFLATFVNFQIAGVFWKGNPETSWRYVFLAGLIPAAVGLHRARSSCASRSAGSRPPPRRRRRASPSSSPRATARITLSGFAMAVIALITWWSCNAFIPVVSTGLAQATAKLRSLDRAATLALVEGWKKIATNYFNLGGLIGTLLTIPAAKYLGRKTMFVVYFPARARPSSAPSASTCRPRRGSPCTS